MVPGTRDEIQVHFTAPPGDAPVSIVVYDARGNALFYPYSVPTADEHHTTTYRFDRSGTFVVGLVQGGNVIATRKINISK